MFKNLFSEINIGKIKLSNRLVVPPMVVNMFDENGLPTERYMAYMQARAKGGFGLIITENLAITREAKAFSLNGGIWNDEQATELRILTSLIHQYDSKIVAQLYHAGRETSNAITGEQNVAPSPICDPTVAERPIELTVQQIKKIVTDFGTAAKRAVSAGFDAVEIHCAHGYLINQFLSPFSNKRIDEYGGPFINRTRFAREILQEVRKNIGPDVPLFCRISVEELVHGGMSVNDMVAFSLVLQAEGADVIDVSFGVFASGGRIAASMYGEHGEMTRFAAQIKSAVNIPVIAVGRINDPHYAEAVIAKGDADLAAVGRGSLADPELPNKAKSGRLEDIAYCTGCRQVCNSCLFNGKPVSCLVNPACSNEYLEPAPAVKIKKILVIGGGIAGMQFAVTAAERGHAVTLSEQSDRLGGQFLQAMMPPNKQELGHLISYLSRRLTQLHVKVLSEYRPSAEDCKQYDVVVAATGAAAKKADIPIERDILTEKDVLTGVETGAAVYIIALGGNAAQTAAFLGAQGKEVTIVCSMSPHERYGDASIDQALQKVLCDLGINVISGVKTTAIQPNNILLDNGSISIKAEDSVVLCTGYESVNEYTTDIVIGDAKGVANAPYAIQTAYEAALAV